MDYYFDPNLNIKKVLEYLSMPKIEERDCLEIDDSDSWLGELSRIISIGKEISIEGNVF